MIVSDLKCLGRQGAMPPGFEKAVEFLGRPGIQGLPDGKYEIDGERVFAIAQRYDTAPAAEPSFEAHRKYIDLQFIASGTETICWAPFGRMVATGPYDEGKDVCFGTVPLRERSAVSLQAGQLAVFYPEDAHAPRLAAGAPCRVLKIVVKVSV